MLLQSPHMSGHSCFLSITGRPRRRDKRNDLCNHSICAPRLAFIGACFLVHPQVAQAVAELWAILKDPRKQNKRWKTLEPCPKPVKP